VGPIGEAARASRAALIWELRMRITLSLFAVIVSAFLPGAAALAQENGKEKELVTYSLVEIKDLMANFKATYKTKKAQEEDAVNVLTGLKDAYRYLDSKGEEATKDEIKAKKAITKLVSRGLFARNRALVNVECARALGVMGDPDSGKQLLKWMDGVVLDAKAPNSDWVEYGFRSMAWVGGTKGESLDFVRSYATGKHVEITVAAQALMAIEQWRRLPGKVRKEFFNKINQYMGGLYSAMRGSDAKKRGEAESKYNAIKDNGLSVLTQLAGVNKPFTDPDGANAYWKENKRRKWEDYIGPKFRKKAEPAKKPAEEKPAEKKPE
jgi:hypothetical protein